MKRLHIIFIISFVFIFFLTNFSNSFPIIQDNVDFGMTLNDLYDSSLSREFGQSFVAEDKYIDHIDVYVGDWTDNQSFSPTFVLTMNLYNGDGLTTPVIASLTDTLPDNFGLVGGDHLGGTWWDFNLSGFELTIGNVYTFSVASNGGRGGIYLSWANPYPKGSFWLSSTAGISHYDTNDLAFRIIPEATQIPEPATMLLFGTGLLGLIGFGSKKLFKKI